MAGYLIYIPGAVGANPGHLTAVGLPSLIEGGGVEFGEVLRGGPDGGAGAVCAWRKGDPATDAALGVHPGQRWIAAKADDERLLKAGRWWLGYDPGRPVKPVDLLRKTMCRGYDCKLADGNHWHIPAAVRLPHRASLDEHGKFVRAATKPYSDFCRQASTYAAHVFTELDAVDALLAARPDIALDETVAKIELDECWQFCCQALAINYRLSPEIIDLLELLDDASMISIVMAVIDLPEINEVRQQKKTYCPVGIPVG